MAIPLAIGSRHWLSAFRAYALPPNRWLRRRARGSTVQRLSTAAPVARSRRGPRRFLIACDRGSSGAAKAQTRSRCRRGPEQCPNSARAVPERCPGNERSAPAARPQSMSDPCWLSWVIACANRSAGALCLREEPDLDVGGGRRWPCAWRSPWSVHRGSWGRGTAPAERCGRSGADGANQHWNSAPHRVVRSGSIDIPGPSRQPAAGAIAATGSPPAPLGTLPRIAPLSPQLSTQPSGGGSPAQSNPALAATLQQPRAHAGADTMQGAASRAVR
jgi:hypothetical protein